MRSRDLYLLCAIQLFHHISGRGVFTNVNFECLGKKKTQKQNKYTNKQKTEYRCKHYKELKLFWSKVQDCLFKLADKNTYKENKTIVIKINLGQIYFGLQRQELLMLSQQKPILNQGLFFFTQTILLKQGSQGTILNDPYFRFQGENRMGYQIGNSKCREKISHKHLNTSMDNKFTGYNFSIQNSRQYIVPGTSC